MKWQKMFIRRDCDVPTFSGVILIAYEEVWKITKQKQEYLFGYFKDKHFHYYYRGIDKWEIGRKIYKERFNTPNQIVAAYQRGNKFIRDTVTKTRKWNKLVKKFENLLPALQDFEKDFYFVNIHYSISPWWALEAWQNDFLEIVGRLIEKNKLQNLYEKIMASLLRPWKETAIVTAGKKIAKGTSLDKIAHEYQFLRSWTVVWHKALTKAWFKDTLIKPKDSAKFFDQKELLKLLKPSKIEEAYIKQAPYISFFKDWRDDLRRRHAYEWSFLFERIANHFKVEINDLGYFTLGELASALKQNKFDHKILQQRKGREFIYSIKSGQIVPEIISGPVPAKYKKAMKEAEAVNDEAVVKGIVAQIGIVRGRVRVVRNHHDIQKVEEKEILVANTTHPDYLQGMQKAVAFVTDEGGIVSHAAIVAREFKKPCIVGTKIATKIFKDGDMVEVDANKGIVRKI